MIINECLENMLLICDNERKIINTITEYTLLWPQKHRKRIQEFFKKMKKKNRIIYIDKINNINSEMDCKTELCDNILSIISDDIDLILCGSSCVNCFDKYSRNIVNIDEYSVSGFLIKRRRSNSVIIEANKYSVEQFSREYLYPIFKYAKSIKIIDRVLGYHIDNHPGELSENYRRGLELIIKSIVESSLKKELLIDIYTTLCLSVNILHIDETRENIVAFICYLEKKFSTKINLFFKGDLDSKFVHDRFIVTNQISIQIGRGIDIVSENGMIRDTVISLVNNPGNFMFNINTLPDIGGNKKQDVS